MDHQEPRDWLHNMSTLHLDVKILRCQNTQTRTAASISDASEAKYTKSIFLHCSGANLNLCLANAKVKRDT